MGDKVVFIEYQSDIYFSPPLEPRIFKYQIGPILAQINILSCPVPRATGRIEHDRIFFSQAGLGRITTGYFFRVQGAGLEHDRIFFRRVQVLD